jgi:hypothetical protein
MIHFNIAIQNPWHNEKNNQWRDFYQNSWSLTENKRINVCIDYYTWNWFKFEVDTRWSGYDHAGPRVEIILFGLGLSVDINDTRHWDCDTNSWVEYS